MLGGYTFMRLLDAALDLSQRRRMVGLGLLLAIVDQRMPIIVVTRGDSSFANIVD